MVYLITGFLLTFTALIGMQHVADFQSFILTNIIGTIGFLVLLQGIRRCNG